MDANAARHGLVIGKFYPPHAGHHHLVRAATRGAARVTVIVMAATVESLSLADRVAWMREEHPDVRVVGVRDDHPVDYESDAIWRAHVDLMQSVLDAPVDAVFTSEPYGEELARRLGARHVLVDLARAEHRVSGTAVRADPAAYWSMLAPAVRAHLALRVILVGAESTGKSTLAAALAERLHTRWVPEVGREVTEQKIAARGSIDLIEWDTPDFVDIARAQAAREAALARVSGPVLICDTDAFATSIWHERYRGTRAAEVDALGTAAPYHLYLVTHHDDVPFHDDGTRDGEAIRAWMTRRFVERLDADGRRWHWLRGTREEREARAIAAIDAWRTAGWGFAPPLG